MLDIEALFELEETLKDELDNHLEEILVKLNQTDKLEDFLRLIGMQELLGLDNIQECFNDGQIIVIGNSEVDKEKLAAVAKNMGFDRDRFEFYLDYEDAKKFDFKKTQWSTKYSCILVGPMPHSGTAKGDYSSVIAALENEDGYPPVVRMGTNGLKITKSSFRQTLDYLVMEKKLHI